MEGLGLWDVVKIAAGSGVVAAGFTQLFQWWKDRKKSRGEAQYRAVQLISLLEQYAVDCSSNVSFYGKILLDPGFLQNVQTCHLPDVKWSDSNLEILNPKISSQVVWLSTEIKLAYAKLRDNFENDSDPEAHASDCLCLVGYFGYKSIVIAENIRNRYGLPALISDWSLEGNKAQLRPVWERAKRRLK